MPFRLGTPELIIILVIVLIIFGVGRLPQVGRALGSAIREFRKGSSGEDTTKPLETKASEKEDSPKG